MFVIVVYLYLFVCLLILLYTVSYVLLHHQKEKKRAERVEYYIALFMEEFPHVNEGEFVSREHYLLLYKKLKHINQLIAFDHALELCKKKDIRLETYLTQIESVMLQLAIHYQDKRKMEKAYFAWFLSNHCQNVWTDKLLYKQLLFYLDDSNVYVRENVLKAIYQQPQVEGIVLALQKMTELNYKHNPKLIQDGLLTHPYDRELLAEQLWENRTSFNETINYGIIGFITLQSSAYKEAFYHLLKQEVLETEMKARIMRYFRRHVHPEIESLFLSYLADTKEETTQIVAAHVLGAYKTEQVIGGLKKALTGQNWYVRKNASLSLMNHDVLSIDMSDIIDGEDKYAKDMMNYHLQREGVLV